MKFLWCIFFSVASSAAASNDRAEWITTNLETVFKEAKAQEKTVLVYWGAQWCPPCNAMKAEVFGHPDFIAATKDMKLVMIDGDGKDAQKWSDHFRATGYPTVIVLGKTGEQVARFVGFTPLPTIVSAIKATANSTTSLFKIAGKAVGPEPLTEEEWRILALSDWTKFTEQDFGGKQPLEIAIQLIEKAPSNALTERSQLIQFVMYSGQDSPKEIAKQIQDRYPSLLEGLIATEAAKSNALPFLAAGGTYLKWFLPAELPVEQQKQRVEAWAKAVEAVAVVAGASLAERLDVVSARASVSKFLPPNNQLKLALKEALLKLQKEIEPIQDPHRQTSLVPELADAFEAIGEMDHAIKILKRAAGKSPVPHYFLGHLAYFLEESGKLEEAIAMRERAMQKATGSATKIQWTWNYIKALNKSEGKDKGPRLDKALTRLLGLVDATSDAFEGRNLRYLNLAVDSFNMRVPESKSLARQVELSRAKCLKISDEKQQASCKSYFDKILPGPDKEISKNADGSKQG